MDKIAGIIIFYIVYVLFGDQIRDLIWKKAKDEGLVPEDDKKGSSGKPKNRTSMTDMQKIQAFERIAASYVPSVEFAKKRQTFRRGLSEVFRAQASGTLASLKSDAQQKAFVRQKLPSLNSSNIA